MEDVDLAYMAGIVDGEGSISLVKKTGNTGSRVQLNVNSTDKELIDWIESKFGGRTYVRNPPTERHKKAWRWRLENHKVIDLLEKIRPYMRIERKIARANILVDEYRIKVKRNGFYHDEEILIRDEMYERFRSLYD